MPSRGIPTTYPAPPFEPEDSGLIGPSPGCPVPCSKVIFSSSVISLTTRAARSSAERVVFIHGNDFLMGGSDWPNVKGARLRHDESAAQQTARRQYLIMSIPPQS